MFIAAIDALSEIEFLQVPCLAMVRFGKLLCFAETEFDLESCAVKFNYILFRHADVGGEVVLLFV